MKHPDDCKTNGLDHNNGLSGLPSDDYSLDSHSDRLARQIEANWNRFYAGA
ncbi:hypothetical protein PGTUg99_012651 [Puccinia graminis f. sp. tritici]|uniref:Uncharacterized protein n=1 Tax=Puccinia graminis f. sp. tritici TaxID=56615 RepID=A0A5B0PWH5_PUCGR|nr:hypothetical protein PGTUg99_012651 [Puccinia graminis f. sp. tritici]